MPIERSTATVISLVYRPVTSGTWMRRFASPTRHSTTGRRGLSPQLRDLLELTASELEIPQACSPRLSPRRGVEFVSRREAAVTTLATVAYNQTRSDCRCSSGVAVQMKTAPFRVLSSQSTQHPDIHVHRPSADALKRPVAIGGATRSSVGVAVPERKGRRKRQGARDRTAPARHLTIRGPSGAARRAAGCRRDGAGDGGATRGRNKKPSAARAMAVAAAESSMPFASSSCGTRSIEEGGHYVSVKSTFVLALPEWGSLTGRRSRRRELGGVVRAPTCR